MNINFPPVDEAFIKSMVAKGYYCNATDVVRDAVRRLRQISAGQDDLREALRRGEEDFAAGRVVPYTSQLMSEITQEVRTRVAEGLTPKDDVLP